MTTRSLRSFRSADAGRSAETTKWKSATIGAKDVRSVPSESKGRPEIAREGAGAVTAGEIVLIGQTARIGRRVTAMRSHKNHLSPSRRKKWKEMLKFRASSAQTRPPRKVPGVPGAADAAAAGAAESAGQPKEQLLWIQAR